MGRRCHNHKQTNTIVLSKRHCKYVVRTVPSQENGASFQIFKYLLYIIVQLSCNQSRNSMGEIMQRYFTMPVILARFVSLVLLNCWHDQLKRAI